MRNSGQSAKLSLFWEAVNEVVNIDESTFRVGRELLVKTIRTPAILVTLLYIGFLVYVGKTASLLPDPMATHFGIEGQANGWMSRFGYITFIRLFGLALPAFTIVVGFLTRFLPASMINIPNRDYWLAPEHRAETYASVLAFCLWVACLEVGFVAGMHYLTIVANRSTPAHLPSNGLVAVLGLFVVGLALWIVALVRRFSKPH